MSLEAIPCRVDEKLTLRMETGARRQFDDRLRELKGKKTLLTLVEDKGTRSDRANRYYWSQVATKIAKSQEMTADEFHDAMCEKFLPNLRKRVEFFNTMTGEKLQPVEVDRRRSSKLSGGPFFDFVERVREFGRDWLGVRTDDPDPEYWRKR